MDMPNSNLLDQVQIMQPQKSAGMGGCSSSRCSDNSPNADLSDEIRAKVETHPCYSEDAHLRFARMHVAVAPACNIQCNYCNRKFDCSNESRPGVVSEVLKPEEALRKVKAVASKIPQLTVMGIAGPGDPLANPKRTFGTLRLVGEDMPGLKLCLSTNGLALPKHVDEIIELGVDHVTITINCVDPHIGAKIYDWIVWEGKRLRGQDAAAVLIAQQLKGLEMLIARGVLVKVNSVMIPGINDKHLEAVSRLVKAKGAFVHNIMPLISDPAHGTAFGLSGQRGPTDEELQALRDTCAQGMKVMSHCKQCRADAIGMLGEDRNEEFTMDKVAVMEAEQAAQPFAEPVRMAVTTSGNGTVDVHFGHAKTFAIYDVSADGVTHVEDRSVGNYCLGEDACGEDVLSQEDRLQHTLNVIGDCKSVVCARIGRMPWQQMELAGFVPNGEHAWENIETALSAIYGELLEAGHVHQFEEQIAL